MSGHARLPWEAINRNGQWKIRVKGTPNAIVAVIDDSVSVPPEVQEASADFIVMACNSHDDLLAACELAIEEITRLNPLWSVAMLAGNPAYDAAWRAIAKAKGGA